MSLQIFKDVQSWNPYSSVSLSVRDDTYEIRKALESAYGSSNANCKVMVVESSEDADEAKQELRNKGDKNTLIVIIGDSYDLDKWESQINFKHIVKLRK